MRGEICVRSLSFACHANDVAFVNAICVCNQLTHNEVCAFNLLCVCVFFYSFILHWICLFLFIYLPFCKCSISAQHIYEIAFFAIESKAFLSVWSLEWMEEKTSFCERNFKWKIQTDKWLKHQHHRCTIRKKEKRFQFVKIFRNCCTWKET